MTLVAYAARWRHAIPTRRRQAVYRLASDNSELSTPMSIVKRSCGSSSSTSFMAFPLGDFYTETFSELLGLKILALRTGIFTAGRIPIASKLNNPGGDNSTCSILTEFHRHGSVFAIRSMGYRQVQQPPPSGNLSARFGLYVSVKVECEFLPII